MMMMMMMMESVPADPASSIPRGLTQLAHADRLRPGEPSDLLAYLAAIDDPRTRAGRRHPLVAILAIAAAAVLAGAKSMTAIAEWATDMPQTVLAALGARRDPLTGYRTAPSEATIRRTLARLEPKRSPPRSAHGLPTVTVPTGGDGRSPSTARRSAAPDATADRSTCSP